MRGLRSFVGLLIVLIALGAYLYFVESKRDPTDTGEKRDKVFAVEADQIDEVSIRAESGERTTMRKTGTDWQITSPAAAPADGGEVSGITSNLARLEEQRLVEENPGDLSEFGLAEPRMEVSFKAGGEEQRLLIGGKTPTGADLYAKTGASARVFLIASYLESTFNRSPFDLRDKAALKFDREQADALQVVAGRNTLRFAKSEGDWRLVQPAVDRPDTAAIEGLLARLSTLQMRTLAEPEAADLKKYGLDTPAATVQVGSGSSQATLIVGSSAPDGYVYAKDASRPAVFTVDGSLLEDLQKNAGEYRQKDVFDARAFNTTSLEVTRGSETIALEKKDGKWTQTKPSEKEPDAAKVDTLLSQLTSARAESFVDALPAGAKTEATVVLKFDDGKKEERVTFSRSGDESFAARADVAGAARITTAALDGILKAFDEAR